MPKAISHQKSYKMGRKSQNNPKFKISNPEINNLDSLNLPLSIKFEVTMSGYSNLNHENITLNPAFWDEISENQKRPPYGAAVNSLQPSG